jgi:hypothetical protein
LQDDCPDGEECKEREEGGKEVEMELEERGGSMALLKGIVCC